MDGLCDSESEVDCDSGDSEADMSETDLCFEADSSKSGSESITTFELTTYNKSRRQPDKQPPVFASHQSIDDRGARNIFP